MDKKIFPLQGTDISELKKYMFPNENNYVQGDGVFLGYPQTTPHSVAIETYTNYIAFNENQLGTFSNCKRNLNITRDLERQLIEMLGDLYGDSTVDGYVTSGGTESNIMGVWIGRKYECVKSMTVDPYKMGYIPYSAGVFMCRKGSQNNI